MQTPNNMDLYKNISCIFMPFSEFQILITKLTDGLREITYELDGISFNNTEKAEETDVYWNQYLNETLSEYFQVPVTSVHADDSDPIGIWIAYRTNQIITVKSTEPEIGNEYWQVLCPASMDKTTIQTAIEMAIRYAESVDADTYDFENEEDTALAIQDYDEHAKEMFLFRQTTNGQEAFAHYLTKFYGCTVQPCPETYDYTYEW